MSVGVAWFPDFGHIVAGIFFIFCDICYGSPYNVSMLCNMRRQCVVNVKNTDLRLRREIQKKNYENLDIYIQIRCTLPTL